MKKLLILKQPDIKKFKEKHISCTNVDPLSIFIKNAVLDHDHNTGFCRGVLDRESNQFLGKIESAYVRFLRYKTDNTLSNILRCTADYLDNNLSNAAVIYPTYIRVICCKFKRRNKKEQHFLLLELGLKTNEIANNSVKRTDQFKKLILKDSDYVTFN